MDTLLQKYNDYIRLKNCRAEYQLSNNFIIQFFNDKNNKVVQTKYVIKRIKNSRFTDSMVKASIFYNTIAARYESFSYDNLTTLNYTDAVINFNPTLINSKIKSNYLLFEQKTNTGYNHLGIVADSF